MFEEDSMEKHVERKLLIAQLAQRFFEKYPGSRSVFVSESDLKKTSPLLTNPSAFLNAAERVIEELAPNFDIDTSEYGGLPGVSRGSFWTSLEYVLDESAKSHGVVTPKNEYAITHNIWITIDNPKRLDQYVAEKEMELAEVRKETNRHSFILDKEANLYLVGSELPPYSIERGSLRHKLIYYLAKQGGYMSAAQIAKRVDSNPKTIRKTVGQLRDMVSERFNVPGKDLIQSKDTGSYCASSVLLRVPKGYTP